MEVTLELNERLENYLRERAERSDMTPEEIIVAMIEYAYKMDF